ncbi:hypothetical protein M666_04425 [Cellulophaga baltica 18]|uniref:Uncharacterized protein n=1 Tax=Cellulophaga baltica 18 TaxID=1348584 RepID=A0AAU8RTE9_9FLAO|nr:hypothetical protein M666_04425 [Cellulophaga baltica 18]KGK31236.1 hypothetical protein EL45_06080 [Cellulophaga sp. E6(2014)]
MISAGYECFCNKNFQKLFCRVTALGYLEIENELFIDFKIHGIQGIFNAFYVISLYSNLKIKK